VNCSKDQQAVKKWTISTDETTQKAGDRCSKLVNTGKRICRPPALPAFHSDPPLIHRSACAACQFSP
jgi:hypothetical protein